MRTADAYADLLKLGRPVIETGEAAARLSLSVSHASHLLRSLEHSGLVRRLQRGLWALQPNPEPFSIPPYLTAPFPAYVSLWSALARHGMIEQIPRQVSVASTAQTRRVLTTLGIYEIHHLNPELFDGYTGSQQTGYLATPEKALFDAVYLRAPAGGGLYLPELTLPEDFGADNQLKAWVGRIARPRLQTLVARGLAAAIAQAHRT
jgi:predicted transcriptional regulator of viral defense system